jgi:hypothetical protein
MKEFNHLTAKNRQSRPWRGNNHIRQEHCDIYVKRVALLWATAVISGRQSCVISCLNLFEVFMNVVFRQYYYGR